MALCGTSSEMYPLPTYLMKHYPCFKILLYTFTDFSFTFLPVLLVVSSDHSIEDIYFKLLTESTKRHNPEFNNSLHN